MSERIDSDVVLIALRAARPWVDDDDDGSALRATILATPRPRRAARWVGAGTTLAAALAVALLVTASRPGTVDMRLVASRSEAAMSSGRAKVTFATGKGDFEQHGTNHVAFSGDDLEMTIDFAGTRGGPGFRAHNKTVDGEFYLEDGIPGRKSWVRDTNASGARGSDLFNADPRALLRTLSPSADFEEVGRERMDGVEVRRLRARSVRDVPPLNLGLGATDGQDTKRLEVWVDSADVVRRIDIDFETTTTEHNSGARAKIVRAEDGSTQKVVDPGHPGETVTVTTHSSYSVHFFDIGRPVTIVPPAHFIEIAAKG